MIFVTVGTHEQPFDRLIEAIDILKSKNVFDDEIIIQKGYSKYEPKYCTSYNIIDYDKMIELQNIARIIITHGGPASFIFPLSIGKKPIVVPRRFEFGEHVNNHQVEFCNHLNEIGFPFILVNDIDVLGETIKNYDDMLNNSNNFESNNKKFVSMFEAEIKKLF